jgi:hypothetical protein
VPAGGSLAFNRRDFESRGWFPELLPFFYVGSY